MPLLLGLAVLWAGPQAQTADAANPKPLAAQHGLGFIPTKGLAAGVSASARARVAQTTTVPAGADLSQWAPPVGDQGPVGSCASWATGYAYRYWLRKHAVGSSPAFSAMYLYSQIARGQDYGSSFPDNFDIMGTQGITTQADYTQGDFDYTNQPTVAEHSAASLFKTTGYSPVFSGQSSANQAAVEATIAAGQPVVIAIPVFANFYSASAFSPLIGPPPAGSSSYGGHALFAPKYDAAGLWIENSWGTGWGASGWGELSWAFVNQYAMEAWTLTSADTASPWSVTLGTSAASVSAGTAVTLTATANQSVQSGSYLLDIRDSGGNVVASCNSGLTCIASLNSAAGKKESYYAFIEKNDTSQIAAVSAAVIQRWISDTWSVSLAASSPRTPVGTTVTLTATTGQDVDGTVYYVDVKDAGGAVVGAGHCHSGTTCTAFVNSSSAQAVTYHAVVERVDGTDVKATSTALRVTWADDPWTVTLAADATSLPTGATTTLTATASRDVGPTPYYTVILDGGGAVVGTCAYGVSCVKTATGSTAAAVTYHAVLGSITGMSPVATSDPVTVTWTDLPGPPTGAAAVRGNLSARVSWTAPSAGGTISAYTVSAVGSDKHCATTGATVCTVASLTNGVAYTFTVTATNSSGTGDPSSPTNTVTPAPVPDAPAAVTAAGSAGAVAVTWAAASGNGSAVGGYTATANPGVHSCTTTGALTCSISGLTNSTPYAITVTATNTIGEGPASVAVTGTPRAGSTFVGLVPNRLLDTSTNVGVSARLAAGSAATFQVTNRVPGDGTRNVPGNATAVTGVLTVKGSSAAGWVAVTPEPNNAPTTSTINFPKGDARSTGVTVPLGSGGKLSLTFGAVAGATTDAIFDVTGYFVLGMGGATYVPLTPNRIADSRANVHVGITTGPLVAGTAKTFAVTGRTPTVVATNVPASAVAVTGTLTVTGQTAAGFLTIGPDALASPSTASLYFPKLDNRATGLTLKLGAGGTLSVTFTSAVAGAVTDVIFDVTGYFTAGAAGATYVAVTPNRLVDSRPTGSGHVNSGLASVLRPYAAQTFQVTGRVPADATLNVPAGAVAVTGSLTVAGQTAAGWLALTNSPNNHPTTSTLNFLKGDIRATGVTVQLSSSGGKLSVTYGAAAGTLTYVIFDVTGYFLG
jgi:hypothetical protein